MSVFEGRGNYSGLGSIASGLLGEYSVCGSKINYDALEPEIQEWLREYAGYVPRREQGTTNARALKHLDEIRICPRCGRATRGNAHWRHVKSCTSKAMAKKIDKTQNAGGVTAVCSLVH